MEQSGNVTRPTGGRMTPIACRVCHKIFFDNIRLVFHYESHLQDNVYTLGGADAVSSQNGRDAASNVSPFSAPSVKKTDVPSPLPPPLGRSCRPLAAISIIRGLMGMNPVRLNGQSGQRGGFSGYKQPQLEPRENRPVPEIIVISDDEEEEDDSKKADEIDLTLRL